MAIQWSDFRNYVRRSILDDENSSKWSDDQLGDMVGWALDIFCVHTAVVSSMVITPVAGTLAYELPDNLFVSPETAGAVYAVSGSTKEFYKPFFRQQTEPAFAYYVSPEDTINFLEVPQNPVTIHYYGYSPHPATDTDLITVPQWSLPAIAYLIGALAMSPESVPTSNINRFREAPEKGTPLDNPMIQQQNAFLALYDNFIKRFPLQNRELYVEES